MMRGSIATRTVACIAVTLVAVTLGLGASAQVARATLAPADFAVSSLCSTPAPGHAACFGLKLRARAPLSIAGAERSLAGAERRSALRPAGRPAGSARRAAATPAVHYSHPFAGSYSPLQLRSAYELPATPATPQTIAIVDAYDDPDAAADLAVFEHQYFADSSEFPTGPPACRLSNGVVTDPAGGASEDGCFLKVNQRGEKTSLPAVNTSWAGEIATDVETAHGICRSCRILLVEAESATNVDLEIAENRAAQLGANEISDSWGGPEFAGEELTAFNHPGIVITAAAGDNGYLDWGAESNQGSADFPAVSPDVVAVGGTRLKLSSVTGARTSETVWNGQGATGGGCSRLFAAQSWQQSAAGWASVGCPTNHRAVSDVSADGDPYTGVAVYDSLEEEVESEGGTEFVSGWSVIGGTSVAAPIIAATYALAGGAAGVAYPAQTLYENVAATPSSVFDVTAGSNGECSAPPDLQAGPEQGTSGCQLTAEAAQCSDRTICAAGPGYDGPSGLGAPDGIAAFQPAASPPGETGGGGGGGRGSGGGSATEGEGGGSHGQEGPSTGGSGEAPASGGGGGGGAQAVAVSSGGEAQASTTTTATTTSTTTSSKPATPAITGLALTLSAIASLNRGHPTTSEISFTFVLNTGAVFRAALAKRVKVHGRVRWLTLPGSIDLNAAAGRDREHLRNRHKLTPGRYRLSVTPLHGTPQTLVIVIG